MPNNQYELAQINIAQGLGEIDDPVMQGFADRLDEINALADQAPGFVWRLQTEDGDATSLRAYDDSRMLVNMSVWQDVASLKTFVYRTMHVELLKDRKEWFTKLTKPHFCMWWIPQGHIPTVDEAKAILDILGSMGPTTEAFTFAKAFPPPTNNYIIRN
jgi:hypothetical protein